LNFRERYIFGNYGDRKAVDDLNLHIAPGEICDYFRMAASAETDPYG